MTCCAERKPDALPIDAALPALGRALAGHTAAVLQAEPGAGKTTRVPLALMDAAWLRGQRILMLEPRRLAARAAAMRMAESLGEAVGATVGYRIRLESRVSAATRIEVVTEGILTRQLQRDPMLEGVGLLIFDEFHERSLHADLGLALARDCQQGLRPDLRLLVMSATLDDIAVARALGGAPIISSPGQSHPLSIEYLPRDPGDGLLQAAAAALRGCIARQPGDVLVFLPGGREIAQFQRLLATLPEAASLAVLPLYGDLPAAAQQQALTRDPQGRRKVVLATPIAESSLTIDGVRTVIDSGLARVPRFLPRSGLTRLETVRISADSATQRAGRAARQGPGHCVRLWCESTQRGLRAQRAAEILDADLAPLALELALWGVADAATLTWLDPPASAPLAQARQLLRELDALDADGRITADGRAMAALGAHPRLAHMLLRGRDLGLAGLAADLAALLSERDLLRGAHDAGSDLSRRVEALRGGGGALPIDQGTARRVRQTAQNWRRQLGADDRSDDAIDGPLVGCLLALAYPDRVAQRRGDSPRYRMRNGRGAALRDADPLRRHDYLVAADLDAGSADGLIYLAAPLRAEDIETLFAAHIEVQRRVAWAPRERAVVAAEQRRLGALVLASRPLATPSPEAQCAAMLDGVRELGLDALPWTPALRQWQARVQSMRAWRPQQDWPAVDDATLLSSLEDWLAPWLEGVTRADHLARVPLADALQALLAWPLRAELERGAPTHLAVPSGSRLALHYSAGEPPVLAVKLQELFGLAETPRIADGQVPVTLHLLSPARRPIQVTQDLRGFWERTYAEVRKELKGRYPRHPWPEDPWSATATARAKPRGH